MLGRLRQTGANMDTIWREWVNSATSPGHSSERRRPPPGHAGRALIRRGRSLKTVALLHIDQIRRALGIAGVLTDIGAWTGDTESRRAQLGFVLERAEHIVDLCERKHTVGEFAVTAEYERHLLRNRSVFTAATRTGKAARLILVTAEGLLPGAQSGAFQGLVTMDDLFASV